MLRYMMQGRLALASVLGLPLGAAMSPLPARAAGTGVAEASPMQGHIETVDVTGPEGRAYRISISRPGTPAPEGGYPVIYVLDGTALFPTVADSMRLQAFRPSWTGIEPAVVVGIGYPTDALYDLPARSYDLTTPLPGADPQAGGSPPKSGGADAFLEFIEAKVKPLVEARLAIDRFRQTLLGHSLGGLCVLHALFTEPDAFSRYVAISPSVWWGDGSLFAEARRFVASGGDGRQVLLTVGEYEQAMSPAALAASGAKEQRAALDRFRMVDGITRMARLLEQAPDSTVRFRLLDGEDHGSGVPRAISLGIRFAMLPADQFDPPS